MPFGAGWFLFFPHPLWAWWFFILMQQRLNIVFSMACENTQMSGWPVPAVMSVWGYCLNFTVRFFLYVFPFPLFLVLYHGVFIVCYCCLLQMWLCERDKVSGTYLRTAFSGGWALPPSESQRNWVVLTCPSMASKRTCARKSPISSPASIKEHA